jgi:hypothetical protein
MTVGREARVDYEIFLIDSCLDYLGSRAVTAFMRGVTFYNKPPW